MKNIKIENKSMTKRLSDTKTANFPSLIKVTEKGKYRYVMAFGIIPLLSIKKTTTLK